MTVALETPVVVYRKGKARTIYNRQTCWFTGLDITPKDGDSVARDGQIDNDRWTEEHIIPVSSHLFEATRDLWATSRRNIIPAAAIANSAAGDLPLAIKFSMRDRLRQEFYGTTDLSGGFTPIKWSTDVRSTILRIRDEEVARYELLGKKIWHNPMIDGSENIRLWDVRNKYMHITQEILDQRETLLATLLEESLRRLNERFGFEITPAIREAMVMDLSRHTVPKAQGARTGAKLIDRRTAAIEGEARYEDNQLAASFADGAAGLKYHRNRADVRQAFEAGRVWAEAQAIRLRS